MLSTNHWRRLAAIVAATALTVIAVVPAAAREVSHSTSQARVAQVVWGQVDPETGAGSWGILAAFDQDDFDGISFVEETAEVVDCGGYESLAGTFRTGHTVAPGSLEIASNLSTASASGTMTIEEGTFNWCTGSFEIVSVQEDVPVSLELVATAGRENTIDRFSDSLPGEYRFMQTNRIQGRTAAGMAEIGGVPLAFDAAEIAKHSSSSHFHGF